RSRPLPRGNPSPHPAGLVDDFRTGVRPDFGVPCRRKSKSRPDPDFDFLIPLPTAPLRLIVKPGSGPECGVPARWKSKSGPDPDFGFLTGPRGLPRTEALVDATQQRLPAR